MNYGFLCFHNKTAPFASTQEERIEAIHRTRVEQLLKGLGSALEKGDRVREEQILKILEKVSPSDFGNFYRTFYTLCEQSSILPSAEKSQFLLKRKLSFLSLKR